MYVLFVSVYAYVHWHTDCICSIMSWFTDDDITSSHCNTCQHVLLSHIRHTVSARLYTYLCEHMLASSIFTMNFIVLPWSIPVVCDSVGCLPDGALLFSGGDMLDKYPDAGCSRHWLVHSASRDRDIFSVLRKFRIIKYWAHILQHQHSVQFKIYQMLKEDANHGDIYNGQNWAHQVKVILEELGLPYILLNKTLYRFH
jgi:hypothetical protein